MCSRRTQMKSKIGFQGLKHKSKDLAKKPFIKMITPEKSTCKFQWVFLVISLLVDKMHLPIFWALSRQRQLQELMLTGCVLFRRDWNHCKDRDQCIESFVPQTTTATLEIRGDGGSTRYQISKFAFPKTCTLHHGPRTTRMCQQQQTALWLSSALNWWWTMQPAYWQRDWC